LRTLSTSVSRIWLFTSFRRLPKLMVLFFSRCLGCHGVGPVTSPSP
jgi:hypothetical protein